MRPLIVSGMTGPDHVEPPLVRDISLAVEPGRTCALVGPSGSGKTTIIRLVAGLDALTAGAVLLGDQRIDRLPTGKRNLALVDQEATLYRHLDVGENLAFPLRMRGIGASERGERVRAESRVHRLRDLLSRRPRSLSAGEQQQAALARGTVRVPELMLLDEPMAKLDAGLRSTVRAELATYLAGLEAPTLMATNDQIDALSLGDDLGVLREGRLVQIGPPQVVYHRPDSPFVAGFLGLPGANLVSGRVAIGGHSAWIRIGEGAWEFAPALGPVRTLADRRVTVAARAEHLRLGGADEASVPGHVALTEVLGSDGLVHVRLAGAAETVVLRRGRPLPARGERVAVAADPEQLTLFEPEPDPDVGAVLARGGESGA